MGVEVTSDFVYTVYLGAYFDGFIFVVLIIEITQKINPYVHIVPKFIRVKFKNDRTFSFIEN